MQISQAKSSAELAVRLRACSFCVDAKNSHEQRSPFFARERQDLGNRGDRRDECETDTQVSALFGARIVPELYLLHAPSPSVHFLRSLRDDLSLRLSRGAIALEQVHEVYAYP
jgi:hypothetical protein